MADVESPIAPVPADRSVTPIAKDDAGMAPADAAPPPPPRSPSPVLPAVALKAESVSPARIPPAVPADAIEAEAAKKRRQAALKDENKKRGVRMFGLLQNTLKQAKKETGKLSGTTKNRQEVQERLHAKLNSERVELEEKRRREREAKELKYTVAKKEEEISTAESIYRVRHATKLNLAGFLCTNFTLPPPPPSNDGITVPYAPRLPHALHLTNAKASRPIYYVPYRLTPTQEDRIEDQIAAVKKAIRRERDDWEDLKNDKIGELAAARRKRDDGMEEIERAEREERQKRRLEDEELEERSKAKKKKSEGAMDVDREDGEGRNGSAKPEGLVHGNGDSKAGEDVGAGANDAKDKDVDVAMDADAAGQGLSIKGAAPDEGKMDVEGDADELEY